MPNRPIAPGATAVLVAVALLLPIALTVILGVGTLVATMGDAAAGRALGWVGLGIGIVWVVDLVALVVLLGLSSLQGRDDEPGPPRA